jgi:hypothetical protein
VSSYVLCTCKYNMSSRSSAKYHSAWGHTYAEASALGNANNTGPQWLTLEINTPTQKVSFSLKKENAICPQSIVLSSERCRLSKAAIKHLSKF